MASGEAHSTDVILTTVVPAFGALISLIMYASPVMAVLGASKAKSLGDLNPFPMFITVANTFCWCTYGLIKLDPFVTAPNAPGVVISLFCALTCYGLADDKFRPKLRLLLCGEVAVLSLLGVLTAFAAQTLAQRLSIWGLAGNVVCLIYYGSPLSTMAEVIKTRNSASILLPMTATSAANAGLWTVYGTAMGDIYIWLPNGIGLVLCIMQLGLSCVFPSRPKPSTAGAPGLPHEALSYSRLTHNHPDEELSSSSGGGKA